MATASVVAVAGFASATAAAALRRLARQRAAAAADFRGRVCWVCGPPCAGKSWLGDFLARYHGFTHIDGDAASYSHAPADVRAWQRMLQAFGLWFRGEPAPRELWEDHYAGICQQAAAAAARGERVVVTFTAMTVAVRDYVRTAFRRTWRELGGLRRPLNNNDGVTDGGVVAVPRLAGADSPLFVWLRVDNAELARRNLARLTQFLQRAGGVSPEDFWKSPFDPNVVAAREKYGEWSEATFCRWQREGVYPHFQPPTSRELLGGRATCVVVDNNVLRPGGGGAVDCIATVLGLRRRQQRVAGTVDVAAVARMNEARLTALAQRCAEEGAAAEAAAEAQAVAAGTTAIPGSSGAGDDAAAQNRRAATKLERGEGDRAAAAATSSSAGGVGGVGRGGGVGTGERSWRR